MSNNSEYIKNSFVKQKIILMNKFNAYMPNIQCVLRYYAGALLDLLRKVQIIKVIH